MANAPAQARALFYRELPHERPCRAGVTPNNARRAFELFFAKQAGEETGFDRVVLVALASLRRGNATHHLVDVLTAARPGGFSALTAGNLTAHDDSLGCVRLLRNGFR